LSDHRIPPEAATILGRYVYALRDPRDGQIFYVGKGVGERVYAHQREADDSSETQSAKLSRISAIRTSGAEVEHLFLRTRISDDDQAFMVEQAAIDALAATGIPLTNLVKGHHSGANGLASVPAAVALLSSPPAPPIDAPLVIFKINRGWRPDSSPQEIYNATRGHWKIGADGRERAHYALGVAHGVIRGAYRIDSWFKSELPGDVDRWGFDGLPAPELTHIMGTNVRRLQLDGSQNPYRKYLSGFPGADPISTTQSPDAGK